MLGCFVRGADTTGVQLDLDRLTAFMNKLVAASQSLTLPARIRITKSADGAFNFGLGNVYLHQMIPTSPTVATWVLGRNLTNTPNTANTAFKAGMDMPQSCPRALTTPTVLAIPSASRLLHCRTDTPLTSTCWSAEHVV